MNGYEKPDNINNRAHGQSNVGNQIFSQNDGQYSLHGYYPGQTGLRNQEISMQTQMPGHLQPNMGPHLVCNSQQYPGILPSNCYLSSNSIYTQIIPNPFSHIPPAMIRPNLYGINQHHMSGVYSSHIDKLNQNTHPNYFMQPQVPIFHPQNPQIQHPVPHIQNQISSHMPPQIQPQIQPHQIQNQYPISNRLCVASSITEKPGKGNSALEIINPDTKESIDLKSYKNNTTIKFDNSKTTKDINDFKESHSDQCKILNISPDKDQSQKVKINPQISESPHSRGVSDVSIEAKENGKNHIEIFDDSEIFVDDILLLKKEVEGNEATVETIFINRSSQSSEEIEISDKSSLDPICDDSQDVNNIDLKSTLISDIGNMKNLINGYTNKFIYTRDELILIGKTPMSRQKPKGLPFKDTFTDPIILDHSMNIPGLDNMESIHSINQRNSKIHKSSQGTPNSWRNVSLKNPHGFPKYINLGNTENVLIKRDDGYITFKQRMAAGEELTETEELVRQIKGILNRIVPQNFDQCLDDLVSLKIGTHEGMTCLVNELFLKAVKEETYSVTFAKICSYLAQIKADVSDHEIVTFRSVLLQKCQAMFTTPLEEQLQKVREEWLLKASKEKPKTKSMMESDVDEQIKKAKDRYYGNIRFIGELYLKGVLITKIICYCIENLLTKENDADSLICLCKLLETCGSKLETETKGKERLNESFKKLRQLSESMLLETRVRFRILDIMEMRQKKWCLRKIQQEQKIEPKTLEEIKIEKEIEDGGKDYYASLTRKNANNWPTDRRPSLPSAPKNRSNFTPKQLSVNNYDSTMLGPQKRNWSAGSGAAMNSNFIDIEKCNRMTRQKGKSNFEHRPKDGLDNSDVLFNQPVDGCVSNYANNYLPTQTFSTCSHHSTNSSETSSRSSSHSRSAIQIMVKEKLPDSKLAQSVTLDLPFLSPVEFFKEYSKSNFLCLESWNSYPDKVGVVHLLLDSNFDTDCDNRISLSNLLSQLINQNSMRKDDLLKAFLKLIESLEDLIIDIGKTIWNSLSDYFIPFFTSMESDSLDLIDKIFEFEVLHKFKSKNSLDFYSLPWTISNRILKFSYGSYPNIFYVAVSPDCNKKLSSCEGKLISIISKNLIHAIEIATQSDIDLYLNWFNQRMEESFNCDCGEFFNMVNLEQIFHQIQNRSVSPLEFGKCLKYFSTICKHNEIFKTLVKISNKNDDNYAGIFAILRCLLITNTIDLQTFLHWESECHAVWFPPKLKFVLTILKNHSAFISDNSFERLLSFEDWNSCFTNSTCDHNSCTNTD